MNFFCVDFGVVRLLIRFWPSAVILATMKFSAATLVGLLPYYLKRDHITVVQSYFTTETAYGEWVTEGIYN